MTRKKEDVSVGLNEFIDSALRAIVQGIYNAQESEEVTGTNAVINPANLNFSDTKQALFIASKGDDSAPRVEILEFDLVVVHEKIRTSETGGTGGVNIQVLQSTLNTGWSRKQAELVTNRIKFSVPILLPQKYYKWPEEEKNPPVT